MGSLPVGGLDEGMSAAITMDDEDPTTSKPCRKMRVRRRTRPEPLCIRKLTMDELDESCRSGCQVDKLRSQATVVN